MTYKAVCSLTAYKSKIVGFRRNDRTLGSSLRAFPSGSVEQSRREHHDAISNLAPRSRTKYIARARQTEGLYHRRPESRRRDARVSLQRSASGTLSACSDAMKQVSRARGDDSAPSAYISNYCGQLPARCDGTSLVVISHHLHIRMTEQSARTLDYCRRLERPKRCRPVAK